MNGTRFLPEVWFPKLVYLCKKISSLYSGTCGSCSYLFFYYVKILSKSLEKCMTQLCAHVFECVRMCARACVRGRCVCYINKTIKLKKLSRDIIEIRPTCHWFRSIRLVRTRRYRLTETKFMLKTLWVN